MKNNLNKNRINADYTNFNDFNEDYSIEDDIELNETYSIFEEEYSDLIQQYDEKEEEFNNMFSYYNDVETSVIKSYIANYEEYQDKLDSYIDDYEKNNAIIKSDIEYYENLNKNMDFEDDYPGYEDSFDEVFYNKHMERSYENEYDNFGSFPINNHLDYGNLHEIDNYADYLDYKDMDTIDFSENRERDLMEMEFDLSFENEMLAEEQYLDYEPDFIKINPIEAYIDDEPVEALIIDEPLETLKDIMLSDMEINQNMDAEYEYLIQNHIYEDEKHDEQIDSYIKSMENERENLLNTIQSHLEGEYSEAEYADYEDFDDYMPLESEDIDFDDLNNLDGTGNIYFNVVEKEDKDESLNDSHYYGDYPYDEN